jgi:hypothetical protein
MSDHEAIRRVIALYAQLLDDQRFDDIGGLFTEDGALPWGGRTLQGRAEIVAGLPATQPPERGRIKHLVFSPVIDIEGRQAAAWSDVIVSLVPPDGPAEMSFVGRYHDRFRHEGGRWRISSHVTVKTGDAIPEGEVRPPSV